MSVQVPFQLPNGMVLWQDDDFMARLHNGDATYGWIGDPDLGVYWNGEEQRVELWRWCEDGKPRQIVRSKPGVSVMDGGLLKFLAEHDSQSRKHYDVDKAVRAHNLQVEQAAAAKTADAQAEANDRLAYALHRETGATVTGTTREFMPLPTAPWKETNGSTEG